MVKIRPMRSVIGALEASVAWPTGNLAYSWDTVEKLRNRTDLGDFGA
jgi:hypothetical protein